MKNNKLDQLADNIKPDKSPTGDFDAEENKSKKALKVSVTPSVEQNYVNQVLDVEIK